MWSNRKTRLFKEKRRLVDGQRRRWPGAAAFTAKEEFNQNAKLEKPAFADEENHLGFEKAKKNSSVVINQKLSLE